MYIYYREKRNNTLTKNKIILGIESSCDETAAAVVKGDKTILSDVVYSQIKEHEDFGGVVPEIAARCHLQATPWVIQTALDQAGITVSDLDAVCATAGPGLIGGVNIGIQTAKAIAYAQDIPFIGVNHLEGHALTACLTNNAKFPFLLLLISGGHTQLLIVQGVGDYIELGTTLDDAVGEAFDKTAKILGLGYPGGPALEQRAKFGDASAIALPCPMKGKPNCDFSFSGLKTRVRYLYDQNSPMSEQDISNMCASFQDAVAKSLENRVKKAMAIFKETHDINTPDFIVAGGVASNGHIKHTLNTTAQRNGFRFCVAPAKLCTDNAVMIAWAGLENMRIGNISDLEMSAESRWPLKDLNTAKV